MTMTIKKKTNVLKEIQKFRGSFLFINEWPSNLLTSVTGGTGSVTWTQDYVTLSTGTTVSSYAAIFKMAFGQLASVSVPPPWTVRHYFSVNVSVDNTTPSQIVYLVNGGVSSYTSTNNTSEHIGFVLTGYVLYGIVGDGTNQSNLQLVADTRVSGTDYILECEFIPGNECKFYVNGSYIGSITSNLPSGSGVDTDLFHASIANLSGIDISVNIPTVRTLVEAYV
jgi:hypothetical protein